MGVGDAVIARLAGRQHGVVAVWQLREVGVSERVVLRRAADGRLQRLSRGVYAVGQAKLRREGRWLAAVLAYGPTAVLSHRSAAALRGIRDTARTAIDITVPSPNRRSRPGIDAHATTSIHPDDIEVIEGIPVTSLARTLLDLADVVPPIELQRAYERAEERRILDVRPLHRLLERSNGRRGVGLLRELLDYDPTPAAETRSELERLFLDLIRDAGLPVPQVNVLVEGFEVDAYWPGARLVVELQSYAHHSDRATFERDHMKMAHLKLAGYEVLPLTHRQVTMERGQTAGTVLKLLQRTAQRVNL